MEDNVNVNYNQYKRKTAEEFREDSAKDILPFHEEITILKTEVKEEIYDFETSVNEMELLNVKEECIPSPENDIEEEDLGFRMSSDQLSCENPGRNCASREADLQKNRYRCKLCHSDFDNEIYLRCHYEQCVHLKASNTDKRYDCDHQNKSLNTYKNCKCTPRQDESCKSDTKKSTSEIPVLVKHTIKSKRFKCSNCPYATDIKRNLVRHIYTHTKEKPFKCTHKICKCTPKQKEFCKCSICGYASAIKAHFNQHVLLIHSDEPKKYKCKDCNYAAHMKASLVLHSRSHTGDRPFKCTYKNCVCTPGQGEACKCDTCEYATTSRGNLLKHVLVKHNTESKKYKCSNCKYTAHRIQYLKQHVRTHANDRPTPFKCTYKNCKCTPGQEESCQCDTCEYAASVKDTLQRHILAKHSIKSNKYKCSDCAYATYTKRYLTQHSRIHKKPFKCTYKTCKCTPEQKEFCECNMCGYAVATQRLLNRHMIVHNAERNHSHIVDRPFKCTYKNCICTPGQEQNCECDTCGFATTTRDNLRNHMVIRHNSKSKKYKCSDCNYVTHRIQYLKQHIHTHTNDRPKPFKCTFKNCKCTPGQDESCQCDICEYAAPLKDTLQRHILAKHTAKSIKYRCNDCDYVTYIQRYLTQHIRTHKKKHSNAHTKLVNVHLNKKNFVSVLHADMQLQLNVI